MDKPKAKAYIDGANIFYTQRKLGWFVDWKRTKAYLNKTGDVLEMRYYTGVKDGDRKRANYLRYFDHIGVTTVTKPFKKIRTPEGYIFKSNFDVEMTADILLDRTMLDE